MDALIRALALLGLTASPALAQNLTSLPSATLPLTGNESTYVVQGGVSKQTPVSTLPPSAGGVTCSGTPTAQFATVNGVVTHC